ncbi:hypothetical protein GCM10010182_05870 [Actinomadura cremea]|nr:hypothetical protein GCM10010182_05870 [Actinomadura cremea]
MLDKWRKRKNRSVDPVAGRTGHRPRGGRFRRKTRRLVQAGMFAAVRGIAYTLGCAVTAWLLVWLTQR